MARCVATFGALVLLLSQQQSASGQLTPSDRVSVLPDGSVLKDELTEDLHGESLDDVGDAAELAAQSEAGGNPEDEDHQEDEEDLREMSHPCYIPSGGDVLGPKRMTLLSALTLCEATSSCMGITANLEGGKILPKARYLVHFKDSFDCVDDADWVSIASSRASGGQAEYIPPPELHWEPPSLETWLAQPGARLLSADPPVVQFDNFLSDVEIAHIHRLAESRFQISTGGMTREFSPERRSSTAWLNDWDHVVDPVLRGIDFRIGNLTGVAPEGMEHLQVLRYDPGQFYKAHLDFVPEQRLQQCGSRVATFFMYLNDVPAGGHTRFPYLKLSVAPAKGRALLWWDVNFRALKHGIDVSTLDEDVRLLHEARPVTEGTKWAANKWLHLRNFVDNYHSGKLA